MPLLELPREHISNLTYERFLREYALPRQPLIIEGVGADWPAASAWGELSYFLSHAGVDREYEVTVHEGGAGSEERECTVGEALSDLQQREERCGSSSPPLCAPRRHHHPPRSRRCSRARRAGRTADLSAWDYVRGGSDALQRDFSVPPLFDRSPRWLAENAVLGCAAVDMKWLYLGQVCSRPLLPCSPVNVAAPPATGRHGLSDARRHEHDFGGATGWKRAVHPA